VVADGVTHPRASDYALGAFPVFLGALALYSATLLPDVGVWDTAEFQALGPVLGIAHPTGYPTYTLLLWLASVVLQPLGNEAYRADLLSALLMAGATALLAARVVMATRRWPLGLAAGAAFALTPVAWAWGLRADPHALHVFLAALLLVLLGAWQIRERGGEGGGARWLIVAAVVYGLALGNHALTVLLAPGIAAFVLLVAPRILWRQWRLVLSCAAALALTTVAVYLYLPLRSALDPPLDYADPQTWDRFWYVVLGQQFTSAYGALPPLGQLLDGLWSELVLTLGALAVLALAGVILGLFRHPRLTVLGLFWFAAAWLWAVGYPNAAIERYYLVPLLVAALLVALAADAIWDALRDILARAGHTVAYRVAVAGLVVILLGLAVGPALTRFDAMDQSGDAWGRQILEGAFEAVEEDAVIISWWSFSTPLWYGQHVEGRRPDVTIIDDRDILDDGYGDVGSAVEAHLGERPVYVIRLQHDVADLRRDYLLTPVPDVPMEMYRVVPEGTD
jgi:heme/copper-type cytochrome/quinol oxidase subunit 3